jgi:acyl transferase domain-containing protein
VAVVGLGCVFPGAPDVATFWDNIVAGRRSITDAPPDRLDPKFFDDGGGGRTGSLTTRRGGFVGDDALLFEPGRFGIMPIAVDDAEPDQLMALKTAAAAIDDAGGLGDVDRERVGVILGRGGYLTPGLARLDQRVRASSQLVEVLRTLVPGLEEERLRAVKDEYADQLGELRPESSIGLVPNLAASRIANRFDFGGPSYTLDAACASSLIAVDAALAELQSGRCDVVLAGGVHHCHDVTLWSVFSQLGALSPSGEIRPYSRHADGILVSEGTGLLVLERLSDAERHGHRVYATVVGTGVASDGRHATLMSPRVEGQVLALQRAYGRAGIDPATVGLVEGHGTATPAGDRAELQTLAQVFGAPNGTAHRAGLGSVKSNIGHAMPAAGAAGLIKAVLAVSRGVLPPTLSADEPHPALAQTRFRLVAEAEDWTSSAGRRAGVNAFGFGGIDAHVIVDQHGAAAPRAADRRRARPSRRAGATTGDRSGFGVRGILLEGRDATELAEKLRAAGDDPSTAPHGRGISTAPNGHGISTAPNGRGADAVARLAVVDPTPRRLELAARVLVKGEPWRGRNDVWFEPSGLVADGGRVAFVFPGFEPTFDADVEEVGRWLGTTGASSLIPGHAASELEHQARRIFETGRLLDEALGRLGVRPDDVAGHSLGEWSAVFTAQLIAPERATDFLEGLEPGTLEVPGVVFVALGCGADKAREAVGDVAGITVSHDNCPHQSVICGPEDSVRIAVARLADRKILTQELPFRSGFHTAYFAPYTEVVRYHWDRMPLQAARIPMWSATTCRPYPSDAEAVRQLAVDHLLHPVRFRELVRAMYDDGVRVFVQMGVGSLVAFADDTLKGLPQLAVAAAASAHPGLAQLARAAAALWVEGVDVDIDQVFGPPPGGTSAPERDRPVAGSGPMMRLSLGTPFVRLPARTAPIEPQTSSATPTVADDPGLEGISSALRAELRALLSETKDASMSVAAAVAAAPSRAVGHSPRPAPSWQQTITVDTSTFPFLLDHCFFRQPEEWKDLSDLFPVVPMTTMVEMLGEAARRLAPELVVTRIQRIRAFRWLSAAPPATVTLTANRTGACEAGAVEAEVSIEGYARATVHLSPSRPPAKPSSFRPLHNPRPSPLTADRLYQGHFMFHGPRFQGMRSITALGDDGIDGTVETLAAPGALLDNAGQLYGWWLMASASSDFLALPQSIDAIDFFGAQPSPGDVVETKVRITKLTDRTMSADLELLHEGGVFARITRWVDRRFDSDAPLWTSLRDPERLLVASPVGEDIVAVEERWSDSASRWLMAGRYLAARERATYEALNPRDQREWLLGRIAAKDAVRHRLWSEGHGPLFPVEVPLVDEGDRAVRVAEGPAGGTRVAIAVCPWAAVAGVGLPAIDLVSAEGDAEAARRRLEEELAASTPGATVHSALLYSPFHAGDGPTTATSTIGTNESEHNERKEYAVAWSQPAR